MEWIGAKVDWIKKIKFFAHRYLEGERKMKREIFLFFNHLCYTTVWGWYQYCNYVRILFFQLNFENDVKIWLMNLFLQK